MAERNAPPKEVWRDLNAGRAANVGLTEREASFLTAAVRCCNRRLSDTGAMYRHVQKWPLDRYALSLFTPSVVSSGVDDGVVEVWDLLDRTAAQYPRGDWWLTSMRAFARTEQLRFDMAEDMAMAALAVRPSAGYAAHALAHVHYETGRWAGSAAWIDRWLSSDGSTQELRCHFAWHAALCELRMGDGDAAARRFAAEIAGLDGPRALIDAGSLLVRSYLAGMPVAGPVTAERVDQAYGSSASSPAMPFAAWNSALLAGFRGDRGRLEILRRQAGILPGSAWAKVALVCRAVTSMLDGLMRETAEQIAALGDTTPMGGSPAQRELLDELMRFCLDSAA